MSSLRLKGAWRSPMRPPGAWLVYGGVVVKTYRIEVYDDHRTAIVNSVNYFELESGRFLRQEKICK